MRKVVEINSKHKIYEKENLWVSCYNSRGSYDTNWSNKYNTNKYMKQFRNPVYIAIIVGITLAFIFSLSMNAQKVERIGDTFVEKCDSSNTKKSEIKKTKYTYIDKKGVSYPVYISSTGKMFIIKTSRKTGKQYRQYLPEITKQLNS